jgi:endoglucanase
MHALLLAVALFRAPGFPTIDAPPISDQVLEEALAGMEIVPLDRLKEARVLVLPYGSAFPVQLWPDIRDFIRHGGSIVVLGGSPFEQPVLLEANRTWRLGARSPAYARELLIGPAEPVRASNLSVSLPDKAWTLPIDGAHTVWELTLRLAKKAVAPDDGSQGAREAVARPLVHLVDGDGIPRACPLIEIQRLLGDDAGGRWIFATSDAPLSKDVIRAMVTRAMQPAFELRAIPVRASIEPGEMPAFKINAENAKVVIHDDRGGLKPASKSLPPGLYHVEVTAGDQRTTTGFWVRDSKLLASAPHMSVSRDWMRRDGKVFPIVGTTYMASDVHRDFLFEPNPDVWDRDFAQMRRLGVNFVRTGIWTGWSRVDESALRAIDAYVQTAAKHDVIVCFTFFAFQPPRFGGSNPFLDPQSIRGQDAFVRRIVDRFRGVDWIHYDLINEPSYSPPDKLWNNLPIGDEWERHALNDWVRAHHGDEGSFVLFTQDVLTNWAKHLHEVIGNSLVTLGQDEGGTGLRSSQQLHAEAVDYTSTHPWWQNDVVLSTGVFAKVPEKPMLFQETGLMRLEDENGRPVRSPELAASMLDRKFADAFAARGAGAIEWAWNINPYMPIDNESVIGLFRPDGTAKPELDVIPRFARFFRAAAPWLDDFAPDPVVVVIPQSRVFMDRPGALDGFRRLIRVLAERFSVVPTAISDLRLTKERLQNAKLVLADFDEVAREDGPLIAFLRDKLHQEPGDAGVATRFLEAPQARLAVYVNDTSSDQRRGDVAIPALRSRLILYQRATGKVLADTNATIAVDQAGYPAAAPKLATVVGEAGSFTVTRDGVVVLTGKLSLAERDENSGDVVRTADFSSLEEPGRYELRAGDSHAAFEIAADPYRSVLQLAIRSYRGQRCGTAVDIGGGYAHPPCHLDSEHPGGWHDAGDYGRYIVNSGISTGTLLWAYELFHIDALDEIRWNVDWMLSMQDKDGSVWHKETSAAFADFVMPQDDHRHNFAIGKSSCAAADFAAVMAIGSRVYRDARMLPAAKRAWNWSLQHPDVTFHNPSGILTGEYGDSDCSDERLWAAAELWRTSGDNDAHKYFLEHGQQAIEAIRPDRPPDWANVGALAAWSYALGGKGDASTIAAIRKRSIEMANAIVKRAQANPYRIPMLPANFKWGSNGIAANYAMQLLIADRMQHDPKYAAAALDILHYLFGRNTLAISWMTGVGANSTLHPHHRPSAADGIGAPWPGLLAGGPNRGREDPVLRQLPAQVPPARAYVDNTASYASNEVAINWNAPLVFVLAGVTQKLQGEVRPVAGTVSLNAIERRRKSAIAASTDCGDCTLPPRK